MIGNPPIAVPTHFYKIIVTGEESDLHVLAFVISNTVHQESEGEVDWARYIVSVDWIEERSGLDFFPELDPAIEDAVESQPASLWPLIPSSESECCRR